MLGKADWGDSLPSSGPRQAIASVARQNPTREQRLEWAGRARAAAIMGSAPGVSNKAPTGVKRWSEFHAELGVGPFMPPSVDDLLAFSRCFRVARTFTNYVAYLKLTCLLAGLPIEHFDRHPALKRAAAAITKSSTFAPREPMFVRQEVVAKIAELRHTAPEQACCFACQLRASVRFVSAGVLLFACVGGVRVHATSSVRSIASCHCELAAAGGLQAIETNGR